MGDGIDDSAIFKLEEAPNGTTVASTGVTGLKVTEMEMPPRANSPQTLTFTCRDCRT